MESRSPRRSRESSGSTSRWSTSAAVPEAAWTCGNLFDLVAETGALPEHVCVRYFISLLAAAEQASMITDRDPCLCPEVIMLSLDGDVLLRNDNDASGLAVDAAGEATGPCRNPPPYCPPDGDSSAEKITVWSLGVLLFCMIAGYPPFAEA